MHFEIPRNKSSIVQEKLGTMKDRINNKSHWHSSLPLVSTLCAMLLSISITSVLFVSTAWAQKTNEVQLVGFTYPPFYQVKNGVMSGIAVDLAKELFSRLDRPYSLSIFPLKRTLSMLENGQADCVLILIKTAERQKYLYFTEPILTAKGVIWSAADRRKTPMNFKSFDDLRRYKIGVTRGYSYGSAFDAFLKTADVETANSDYSNLLKLLQHRIDIFPGNELVIESLIKEHPELQDKLLRSSRTFIEWDLRIAVSQKSRVAMLLPEIEAVLSDLKREGVVTEIVQKYLP